MKLSQLKTTKQRRDFFEKKLKIKLSQIEKAHIEAEKNIHCENLIGETTLPLGVAGPLKIKNLTLNQKKLSLGQGLKIKNYFIPLATTEGALVASVNRGCKAINLSGGVNIYIEKIGTTRGPVYETEDLKKGFWFLAWLKKNEKKIKQVAEKTSNNLRYLKFDGKVVGPYTFVRFYFDTSEAMGMNMVTIATDLISRTIEKETGVKHLSISGNFCVDKKPSWLNFISGRGWSLWAETVLNKKTIKEVLKVSAERMFQVWLAKTMIGSAISGSLGFNSHFANVVAAFFAATGQDLGHVVEGSQGITTTKILTNRDLYFSVYLPSVMIGMVGGGTKLKIKKEATVLTRAKNRDELVQVLGGAVIAGEISLLASLAEGSLASVHKKLGR